MPAKNPRWAASGPSRSRVMPTATELSITTVEPVLAYVPTVLRALRRKEESIVRSGRSSVGTEMRKCVANIKTDGSLSYRTLRPSVLWRSFCHSSSTLFLDTSNPMTE